MSQQSAIDLINRFLSNNSAIGQWPNIDKPALVSGLIERINNPNLIDQAATPLCGPATVVRSLARSNPDAYAQAGIDLYTRRQAMIGTYNVRPRDSVVRATIPGSTNPADWLILGSLRDSSNWFLSTAGWFRSNIAGVTIPSTIESWFRGTGFTDVVNETDLSGGDIPVVKSMRAWRASQYATQGYNVAMLIDMDLLDTSTQNDWVSMYPDHWVVLTSAITNAGTANFDSMCSFQIFTWGQTLSVPVDPSNPLTHEYFLNKFYGFVAARL